jgi:hypothetical protein
MLGKIQLKLPYGTLMPLAYGRNPKMRTHGLSSRSYAGVREVA